MKIKLATIPFYWPRAKVFEFYEKAVDWQVDHIVLGETICSKRRELNLKDWLVIAEKIKTAGKQVSISSLALIESASEYSQIKSLLKHDIDIEANDLGTVQLCYESEKKFQAGPYLNIYNLACLELLYQDGLQSWCMPVELGRTELQHFITGISSKNMNIETEVFSYGYLPLALSARCFTARALNLPKDKCERRCIDYTKGITVDSQDGTSLFTINGIQTLSGKVIDLLSQVHDIQSIGAQTLRLSPSQDDMSSIINNFKAATSGKIKLNNGTDFCNGYWFGADGMKKTADELVKFL